MSGRRRVPWFRGAMGLAVLLFCVPVPSDAEDGPVPQEQAREIFEATGLKGGLVVHLGCGDGKLTAALRAGDSFLVQGWDTDAGNVRKAREHVRSLGLYGNVSVDRFDGDRLPYVDNLANLVVAEDLGGVPRSEVMRVLCPEGMAYVKQGGRWSKTVKPRPEEIDEWTHYLYDESGNAVSRDMVVGPPRHFQWTGSPRWCRHHDRRSSISAMVSASGRNFYIFDEGSTASILLPAKTMLIARDAFNGTILWKRPIPTWHPHLWPLKSGPTQLQRRLVAVGDRVYVTLGLDAHGGSDRLRRRALPVGERFAPGLRRLQAGGGEHRQRARPGDGGVAVERGAETSGCRASRYGRAALAQGAPRRAAHAGRGRRPRLLPRRREARRPGP